MNNFTWPTVSQLKPASMLILRGTCGDMATWQLALRSRYLPEVMIFALTEKVEGLPDSLNKPLTDKTTAWLCQGTQCLQPITELDELLVALHH